MGDGKHMDLGALETLLQAARQACVEAECPLSDRQLEILLQTTRTFAESLIQAQSNPLDQLAPAERQVFLDFVQRQSQNNQSWKASLLNDWLQGNDSGPVQVIRDRYGISWLDRIQPIHLAPYLNRLADQPLQIGDRIEVTNALWEWVPEDSPRDWFACTVIGLSQTPSAKRPNDSEAPENPEFSETSAVPEATEFPEDITCIVRFDTGVEYEIPAVYDWNRSNWRWIEPQEIP